jgi:hypothetical protein
MPTSQHIYLHDLVNLMLEGVFPDNELIFSVDPLIVAQVSGGKINSINNQHCEGRYQWMEHCPEHIYALE